MANIFGSFRITSRFTVSTWKKRNVNLKFFGKIYSFMESWKKKPNSLRSEIFGGQNSFLKTPGCSALLLNMAPSPGFFKFLILSQGRRFFFFFLSRVACSCRKWCQLAAKFLLCKLIDSFFVKKQRAKQPTNSKSDNNKNLQL